MRGKRIAVFCLAATLILQSTLPLFGSIVAYANKYDEQIEEIEEQVIELDNELTELEVKLNELEDLYKFAEDKNEKAEYKKQITEIKEKMKTVESQIKAKEKEIEKLQEKSEQAGETGDAGDESKPSGSTDGPGDSSNESEEGTEEKSDIHPPTEEEKNKVNVDPGDVTISTNVKPVNGKIRTTEIYSINNTLGSCYYRPKVDEVPLLTNRVLKMGKYAAAYSGFFDIYWKEPTKPKGGQTRALEVLGYDFLLMDENYDINRKVYKQTPIKDVIYQETAIMNIYKALGLEQYDVAMYHEKGDYTSGTSPVAALLGRSTLQYSGGGQSSIRVTDTLDPYITNVFVTRTNPELYMRKLSNDMNISLGTDKKQPMTLADFIIMCSKFMEFYGEPVLSKAETNQLLQAYGAEVPVGVSEQLQEAWIYLKARGVLNVDTTNMFSNLTKDDMFDILMCIKDKDSRTNYKEIQLTYELNAELVDKGYYPQQVTVTETADTPVTGEVSYADATIYDYLIPINEYSKFISLTEQEVSTQYVCATPEPGGADGGTLSMQLEGAAYIGKVDDKYYHFVVQCEVPSTSLKDGMYLRVDTLDPNDAPGSFYMQHGGGIYKLETSTTEGGKKYNYFKRRPFTDIEYEDYVCKERKSGVNDFDYDEWGKDDNTASDVEIGDDDNTTPDVPDLGNWGLEDWEGCSISGKAVKNGEWVKDPFSSKWRYYTKDDDGTNKEYLKGDGYYINATASGDIADHIFQFDNDGYMVTGWYQEGRLWAYFDENGHLVHDTTMTIDGVEYEFDMWGWWIDMNYNIPEDREDDWSYKENTEGAWQKEANGKWWYLLPTGDFLWGEDVWRINDKLYYFDEEGYMGIGWKKIDGNWYYFDKVDGNMLMNTVTPDGYKVGINGRAVGKLAISWNGNTFSVFASIDKLLEPLKPMTVYADTVYTSVNSLGSLTYNQKGRRYNVTVFLELVKETEQEVVDKVKKADSTATARKSSAHATMITVNTVLPPATVAAMLTYKSNSNSDLTLVTAGTGIAKLGGSDNMSMLVPFESLVQAGLFTDVVQKDGDVLTLTAMGGFSGGKNNDPSSKTDKRTGYGQVYLNSAENTIMVGPTIYSIKKGQQLFYLGPSSSDISKTYGFVDKNGSELDLGSNVLYVDFRVAFGWAANEISFYQMNKTIDTNYTGGAQMVVSVGSAKDKDGNVIPVRQLAVKGTGLTMRAIPSYYNNVPAILAANNYPLASWSIITSATNGSTEDVWQVSYYPEYAFDNVKNANGESPKKPAGGEDIAKFKSIMPAGKKIPEVSGYLCRIKNVYEATSGLISEGKVTQVQVSKGDGNQMAPGQWYLDKDFGYIYLPYTKQQWIDNGGYYAWLNGDIYNSIVWDQSTNSLVDMSVPAFTDGAAAYGETVVKSTVKGSKMLPSFSALSYFIFAEQTNNVKINTLSGTNNRVYFGSKRVTRSGSNLTINGISNTRNEQIAIPESEFKDMDFTLVNRTYDEGAMSTGSTSNTLYNIYVAVPGKIEYTEASGSESNQGEIQVGYGVATNPFKGYEEFTLQNLIHWLDTALSLVILFAVQVIPIFGFTASLVVFGFALMADFKAVKWFCNKIFDPVKFLTHGAKDIETVGGIKFFLCVLGLTVTFALCIDGNILRIFNWIFAIITEYSHRIKLM